MLNVEGRWSRPEVGALIGQTVRIVDQSVDPMLYFILMQPQFVQVSFGVFQNMEDAFRLVQSRLRQTAALVGKLWLSCLVVGDRFVPLYEDGLKVVGFFVQYSEFSCLKRRVFS